MLKNKYMIIFPLVYLVGNVFSQATVPCEDPRCTKKVTELDGSCKCIEYTGGTSNPGQGVYIDPITGKSIVQVSLGNSAPTDAFFATELPFIRILKGYYNSNSKLFNDPFLDQKFSIINNLKNRTPKPVDINKKYDTQLEPANWNTDIYLADIIISKITGVPKKYAPSSYQLYYYFSSGSDIVEWFKNTSKYIWEGDYLLNTMPDYLLKLNIMALLDKDVYSGTFAPRRFANTMLYNFLTTSYGGSTVADFKERNNLCMRSMAAIAIEDLSIPKQEFRYGAKDKLKAWMQEHFSSDGGYGEGTDYLGYLNEIVLPYFYIGYSGGWISSNDPEFQIMANAGQWLLDIIDPSGYLPEIDDACGGKNFPLAPYIALVPPPPQALGAWPDYDYRFRNIATKNLFDRDQGKALIDFLTYDPHVFHLPIWTKPWEKVVVHGGIGKINLLNTNDTISLTLVTEKSSDNPDLKEKGGSHDQQDHGSIVLRRSTSAGVDQLLLDPLYAGYKKKVSDEQDMLYSNHNTLQVGYHPTGGVNKCPKLTVLGNSWYTDNGGGLSDITKKYDNGFSAQIFLDEYKTQIVDNSGSAPIVYNDEVLNANYDRSVIAINNTIIVFDRLDQFINDLIPSKNNLGSFKYSLHYNLPYDPASPSLTQISSNVLESYSIKNQFNNKVRGDSKFRMYAFSNLDLEPYTVEHKSFWNRDRPSPDINNPATEINSVSFSTKPINLYSSIPKPLYLTILDIKGQQQSFDENYTKASNVIGNGLCATRKNADGTLTYVFINCTPFNEFTINSLPNAHYSFASNAKFGVVIFDCLQRTIRQSFLYGVTSAKYNNVAFNLDGTSIDKLNIAYISNSKIELQWNSSKIVQTNTKFSKPSILPIINLLLD